MEKKSLYLEAKSQELEVREKIIETFWGYKGNMERNYRIYKYIFPNGMIYIGMTKNSVQKRRDNGYQHNERLRKAIKKYTWKEVQTVILISNLSKRDAEKMEIYFIKKFKADDPSQGYNISKGGSSTYLGLKHSEEYKKHMSELNKGKVFSQITLERMREARKKQSKPVIEIKKSGENVRYESLNEAARKLEGHATNICRACKSGREYKESLWIFERGDEK